jgi:hypothetical protein
LKFKEKKKKRKEKENSSHVNIAPRILLSKCNKVASIRGLITRCLQHGLAACQASTDAAMRAKNQCGLLIFPEEIDLDYLWGGGGRCKEDPHLRANRPERLAVRSIADTRLHVKKTP